MAAAIAVTFNLDPVAVLRSTREEWRIRVAAYTFVQQARAEAAEPKS